MNLNHFLVAFGLAAAGLVQAAAPLPAYNVDIKQAGVSGLSSGAFMASQVGVGFSSYVKYVAIVAGGPTWCAKGVLMNATSYCMAATSSASGPNPADYIAWIKARSADGTIDDKSNLTAQRWWLFSGSQDTTVYPYVDDANKKVMDAFVASGNLAYVNRRAGTAHTQPTLDYGSPCDTTASPYVGKCAYDAAGAMFAHLYGTLNPRKEGALSGSFIEFDQSEFLGPGHSVADTGHAYVPAACAAQELCKVHIALHGCKQMDASVGDAYYRHGGYNEWADTNNIIMVYPQTITTMLSNPNGCWDWWGYDDANYALKSGRQMAMMDKIFKRVASGFAALPSPSGLAVTATTNTSVSLSWNALAAASAYDIHRNGGKVNASPITATSYTDNGLSSGTTYSYTVDAQNAQGQLSAQSPAVIGKTSGNPPPLAAPTVVTTTAPTASSITVGWNAAVGANLRGYNVYRANASGGPYTQANPSELGSGVSSYVVGDLASSTKYYFAVRAVDTSGIETANSTPVANTTAKAFPCTEATACVWSHYLAGRAVFSPDYLHYWAKGSNQDLGLTGICGGAPGAYGPITVKNTAAGYYEKGSCTPSGSESGSPTVPGNLTLSGFTDTSAELTWIPSSGSALKGYNIYRSTNGGVFFKINGVLHSETNYSDSGLASNTVYHYTVRAVDGDAVETANSNTVSVATLAAATSQSLDIVADANPAAGAPSGYIKANCVDGAEPQVGTLGNLAMGKGVDGKCNRAVLSFDTSAIPDSAIIAKAYLTVHFKSVSGNPWTSPSGNKLVVDVMTGVFGATQGSESIDWANPPSASAVANIGKFGKGKKQSLDFNDEGLAAINKAGLTQLKLRFIKNQSASGTYLFITKDAVLHIEYK